MLIKQVETATHLVRWDKFVQTKFQEYHKFWWMEMWYMISIIYKGGAVVECIGGWNCQLH